MAATRLDVRLVRDGLAQSRARAAEYIKSGLVSVRGRTVTKPAFSVEDSDAVVCADPGVTFVGRGGHKLEKALEMLNLPLDGMTAMDVGASTGGFTECMLRRGASKVYAVDVGHGQLHPSLCADSRVINLEGTDVRSAALQAIVPAASLDLCAVDVSFISLCTVYPHLLGYLKPDARLICLIKPQFEAGRGAVGKGGIVRDKRDHYRVLETVCAALTAHCTVEHLSFSPVTGGDGNIEYLAVLRYIGKTGTVPDVHRVADAAFANFSD